VDEKKKLWTKEKVVDRKVVDGKSCGRKVVDEKKLWTEKDVDEKEVVDASLDSI
jgi:hypothetical protein